MQALDTTIVSRALLRLVNRVLISLLFYNQIIIVDARDRTLEDGDVDDVG